jgi:hypothetical protein
MAWHHFGGKTNWSKPKKKKKNLNEKAHGLENQSVSYSLKLFISSVFVFSNTFKKPLSFKFCENGRHAMD